LIGLEPRRAPAFEAALEANLGVVSGLVAGFVARLVEGFEVLAVVERVGIGFIASCALGARSKGLKCVVWWPIATQVDPGFAA